MTSHYQNIMNLWMTKIHIAQIFYDENKKIIINDVTLENSYEIH